MVNLAGIWKKLPLYGKILLVIFIVMTIGFIRTNWLFFVIAWLVIIFYAVKTLFDLEVL